MIIAVVIACVCVVLLDWWLLRREARPEQQHDVLTGDAGNECMEGSFEEW